MLSEDAIKDKDLAELTTKAYYELGIAKSELEEKENLIKQLSLQSMERYNQEIKLSKGVKEKIDFLQNLASSLSKKNEELENTNKKLEVQKSEFARLTSDLRRHLETVIIKENELKIQKEQLERRVSEQSSELSKSKKMVMVGEFSSKLGDQLAVPLSMIKDCANRLESHRLKIHEKIMIARNLEKAYKMMSHHTDCVKNFVSEHELNLRRYSIAPILTASINAVMIPASIRVEIDQTDLILVCDPKRLQVVFSNLILNAIQAVGEVGKITIRTIDYGTDVMVAIEDSGKGISDDMLQTIFDPLITSNPNSAGIGLTVCKNIIERHGGTITVKNNPTTFMIKLPKNYHYLT